MDVVTISVFQTEADKLGKLTSYENIRRKNWATILSKYHGIVFLLEMVEVDEKTTLKKLRIVTKAKFKQEIKKVPKHLSTNQNK